MDRMDYLKRDSFYSGVAEGNINSDRLIQMMNVQDDVLVIEEKGIYSVEKFLVARRLMYWQAYLHKTSVVAELTLTKILKRAKELSQKGVNLTCSESLSFFLKNKITMVSFDEDVLKIFALLDDYDVLGAIKSWQFHSDFVLSSLCNMIINRDLLKIIMSDEKIDLIKLDEFKTKLLLHYPITEKEIAYFVFKGKLKNQAYNKEGKPIRILRKDGSLEDVVDLSDQMNLRALSKPVTKYYLCFPKNL
jgi:HD superfamily phosphohydrolase